MAFGDILGKFRLQIFVSTPGVRAFQVRCSPCSSIGDARARRVYADDGVAHDSSSLSDLDRRSHHSPGIPSRLDTLPGIAKKLMRTSFFFSDKNQLKRAHIWTNFAQKLKLNELSLVPKSRFLKHCWLQKYFKICKINRAFTSGWTHQLLLSS